MESPMPCILCEEPIRLCTSAPSTTHVRAYIVVGDRQPPGTQSLTPYQEEIPQASPSNPNQMGGPCTSFRWILGTLGMPN